MIRLKSILFRIRALFTKQKLDADMAAEMRSHIEMQTQENIAAGMSPGEARTAAMRQFGAVEAIKEVCRDLTGVRWIEHLVQDVRYGARTLLKSPGFTVVSVLTLALGIGACAAIFSVVDVVLLNPIPDREPERLWQIAESDYHHRDNKPVFNGVASTALEALLPRNDFFSDAVWLDYGSLNRKTEYFVDFVSAARVSPNFFSFWSIPPFLGRTFAQDEGVAVDRDSLPLDHSVTVLSYAAWQSFFHGDPTAIGKTIELSDRRFTVIGVMPPEFRFPAGYTQCWWPARDLPRSDSPNTQLIVRLKTGVGVQQTKAMLDTLARQLISDPAIAARLAERRQHNREAGFGFWMRPLSHAFTERKGLTELHRTLWGLLGAIGFVLLIVCVNVANLVLARTERRQHEFAIRSALGAGRSRLTRQLLTESLLLAGSGGIGGVVIAFAGMKLLVSMFPDYMPQLKPIEVDGHVLGVALGISLLTGVAFGMAPAWVAGRAGVGERLKQAGTTMVSSRCRSTLVVAEVALALVLLTGAGLMVQSVMRMLHANPGFDPEHLLFVDFWVPTPVSQYPTLEQQEQRTGILVAELHERLAATPQVEAVGLLKVRPDKKLAVDGRAAPVHLWFAGSGVDETDTFRAMRVPLLAGRYFDKSDLGDDVGTVILNASAARLCWPGQNAIGKKLRMMLGEGAYGRAFEVVGVVGDARTFRYDEEVQPTLYRPSHNFSAGGAAIRAVVRSQANPEALVAAVRRQLKAVAPGMETPRIQIARQVLYESTQVQRTFMIQLVMFAGVGLLLSALGIYGVLTYSIARRTREIGIRVALGAQRNNVLGLVLREGARLVGAGMALGLLAAWWLTQLLRHQLFEVSPTEPGVFAGVVLLLVMVALLACLVPARRAARINPMEALRYE